jgi:hypothetical protein
MSQARRSFLERLGHLYEHPIRVLMVEQMYMREMSPKQFFEQIDGTSYASVRRHFQKLTGYGWLRKVRTAPPLGPGRPEHLYRATELAVIDDETWGQIPVSIRDAFTILLLEESARRLGLSAAAGTLRRGDNVCGFAQMVVDPRGWREANDVINSGFWALTQEQTDAKVRLESSGSRPLHLVVTLAGFELPSTAGLGLGRDLSLPTGVAGRDASDWGYRISRVFCDRHNLAIIAALNSEAMSPSQLHERIGGPTVEGFDHRCKQMVSLGWAVKVGERTGGARRGATENFYRATVPDISEKEVYAPIPVSARDGASWAVFEEFCREAITAVKAGTFNARADRHFTMSTLLVDELGKQQVLRTLQAMEGQLARIHQESRARLGATAGLEIGALITSFEGPLIQRG